MWAYGRGQTHTQTDTPQYILRRLRLTQNVTSAIKKTVKCASKSRQQSITRDAVHDQCYTGVVKTDYTRPSAISHSLLTISPILHYSITQCDAKLLQNRKGTDTYNRHFNGPLPRSLGLQVLLCTGSHSSFCSRLKTFYSLGFILDHCIFLSLSYWEALLDVGWEGRHCK